MALALIFLFGIANFALHKAVLESGHPLIAQLPIFYRSPGGKLSLMIEFGLLLGVMLAINNGGADWVWGYAAYSAINAFSAWLILSRRV